MTTRIRQLGAQATLLLLSLGAIQPAWAAVTVTYLHTDALGSPVAATDAAGAVKWREAYRPYGARTKDEPGSANQTAFFGGHSEDEVFGLIDMGARSYDPTIGRFLAVDPAAVTDDARSFNRYAYAANNPYVYVDPDGRFIETALDVVSLGLSVAAFYEAPTLINGLALAWDAVAVALPGIPGGAGLLRHGAKEAAQAAAPALRLRVGKVVPKKTATGLNYADDVDVVHDVPHAAEGAASRFEVFLHAGPDKTSYGTTSREGGVAVFAQQIARDIKADPRSASADTICLNICFGGSNGLAEEVATALGRPVEAFFDEAVAYGPKVSGKSTALSSIGVGGRKGLVFPAR